jgi:hypothetical protein
MKKFCFYAVAIMTTATLVSSCQKEKITPTTDLTQLSDADLAKKIGDFRTQVLDAKKSGNTQTISFGDAIYLMEAVFNYYHGFTGEEYAATVTETITLPIGYNTDDEISFTELNSIFVELNNTMVEKFEALKLDNKRTMMFDVELTEEGLQVLMTAGSVETNKVSQECINEAPFGGTDYWYPGHGITSGYMYKPGKCGQYTGMYEGVSCALLEQAKAALKYRRGNYNGNLYYFANIETKLGDYEADPLFYTYMGYCFTPAEMNTIYQTIGSRIDYHYQYFNISQNKQFANIVLCGNYFTSGGAPIQFGIFSISYGEKRVREQTPELPSSMD